MLLLIDIFSINKGRGYENPSLEIIVTEHCSIGGCPLEEAYEHCFLNQSDISIDVLISFMCYCGDYDGYITVIPPFLAFYLCSAYFLYLVSCSMVQYFSSSAYYTFPLGTSPSSNAQESDHQLQIEVLACVDLLSACILDLNSAINP
jgi:hypothetical protein